MDASAEQYKLKMGAPPLAAFARSAQFQQLEQTPRYTEIGLS
jgi:hypothetical protein